ncbi:hypothetical protein [Proteiniclasticum ruminis]|uniref:Uncharacterized protein n=1 Tax=Proteiniclasticum ruminis TaxID=398199 RepID=A0A1G8RPG7_9CLOT|nr:hypothetical protein [Proteiniclasticum ruminis]SDJ18846.1 hypothetical protein SAMN05421804_10940 [Proteiniclasticum ruminis]
MNLNFDFEKYTPPKITEEKLTLLAERRREVRQLLLLTVSSHLLFIALGLAAFLAAPYSMALSVLFLSVLALWLAGTGVIAVVFTKKQLEKREANALFNLLS